MPLAKSQVLILSDLHHSRGPVIEGSQFHKLDGNPTKTIAIQSSSPSSFKSTESTLKTRISQTTTTTSVDTEISSLSPADDQLQLDINNPWGPMFKDYEAFMNAHVF